jgi:colanic acid biosynthesis glycosyl transferase WcaI
MAKPSVLIINRVYPPLRGATGRVLRDLSRGFAADGWDATILTTGPKTLRRKENGIQIIRIKAPTNPRNMFEYGIVWMRLFMAATRLERRDLLVSMTDPPLLVVLGAMIARMKKMRHMHWCQDLYPDLLLAFDMALPAFAQNFLQSLSDKALQSCDRVMVIGRCMGRRIARKGVDKHKISMIPNWPDRELMQPHDVSGTAKNNYLKDFFAYTEPKFRILYSGTMGRAHPMDTVMDAARWLNDTNPEIEFVFVGDGKGHEELARKRDQWGLSNIRCIPWQPLSRLKSLMESGDIHLVSLLDDAAGMIVPCKLYSAFAVGRPVIFIGPSQSEAARTITEYKAGKIVAQFESKELIDAILDYRLNAESWYAAHEGAAEAGRIFQPRELISAWIKRARSVVDRPKENSQPKRDKKIDKDKFRGAA